MRFYALFYFCAMLESVQANTCENCLILSSKCLTTQKSQCAGYLLELEMVFDGIQLDKMGKDCKFVC